MISRGSDPQIIANPFLSHEYASTYESSGVLTPRSGLPFSTGQQQVSGPCERFGS
jgi:hypothetical protein